jgi:hypothetical protein
VVVTAADIRAYGTSPHHRDGAMSTQRQAAGVIETMHRNNPGARAAAGLTKYVRLHFG